ncbi:hypothetical protein BDA96_03G434200 [Sorghum bicolor]|uniref:Uncharacterized protein n=2 Tax=Sorghum bicolor TaxID=4558 RepID=A0A921URM4_SORBI|nr:hypothetical protein BDA96_03G434200 [Sorghum bicolor]OQU88103.1 hypothetical protein SORBI_3003G402550 [Sorghum bicolor]
MEVNDQLCREQLIWGCKEILETDAIMLVQTVQSGDFDRCSAGSSGAQRFASICFLCCSSYTHM